MCAFISYNATQKLFGNQDEHYKSLQMTANFDLFNNAVKLDDVNTFPNKTIALFINQFEMQFSEYLIPSKPFLNTFEKRSSPLVVLNYSIICIGEKKFSDWDIHFWVNPETANEPVLKSMRSFILNFSGFLCPTEILSYSDEHKKLCQHIKNVNRIQMMAFMPQTHFAPFVDIIISHIDKEVLNNFYQIECEFYRDNFVNWCVLTYWRKLKNGNRTRYLFLDAILPSFSSDVQKQIRTAPEEFFKEHFKNQPAFEEIINFLL